MSYPREESIQRAMETFWKKGYLGTGMRDLQAALDKRPGSIYSAFGNKEGLYLEVLNSYTQRLNSQILDVVESQSPLDELRRFLCIPLSMDDSSMHKVQCLIIKTQADWTELPDNVQRALQTSSELLRHSFQKIILKAQSIGELGENIQTNRAATWLQGQFIALRTLAAGMENPADIEWMVDKIIGDLPNNWEE
ncbi:TetR family transcriptional regulator [Alteromonas sp. KUL42]|uniref:TetR/AcrR family transcriptional regulator n=1 Tax=Alteromonas sp. KUL42 TaxID=2480797 RepID=UPI0007941C6F|nr:TetR/AcrR family transcriptional regulator [Alteromonas sp. KUL42]KXJ60027.1 MAG: hypothetical protein AXW14_04770 [Alteromonas sp. Nap_26]TAP35649.1 TetR/AcrR family transcriptional regulator [Alteromonas sp. KUL42]GEA07137.1 TetR family transcriptional regulator [Alteromonas sp. KUL42]